MFGPVTSDVRVFAICSSVLYVKFLAATMIQGRKGFHAGSRAKEDTGLFCAKGTPKQDNYGTVNAIPARLKVAYEDEQRWKRIVQNDIESIPMACVVFFTSMAVGGSPYVNTVLMVAYTAARVAHTVCYALQLQPHRMFAWLGGIFCILGAALNGVVAAIDN